MPLYIDNNGNDLQTTIGSIFVQFLYLMWFIRQLHIQSVTYSVSSLGSKSKIYKFAVETSDSIERGLENSTCQLKASFNFFDDCDLYDNYISIVYRG